MIITSVSRQPGLLSINAIVDGAEFEFTSHKAEAFEVYDHPAPWIGVPRYVGAMSDETSAKLRHLARQWQADRSGYSEYLYLVARGDIQ